MNDLTEYRESGRERHWVSDLVERFLLEAHRALVFRRAMRAFLRAPETCTQIGNPVIVDLVYGWGNRSYSALDEYLVECIANALSGNGAILECGSGLSTILVGAIAKRRGRSHWVLENDPGWATKVQRQLDRYRIDSVVLCAAPLKDYGEFSWYDPPLRSMPDDFTLVICDGPPGITKGGRYGLVPVMGTRIAPGCLILLDDARRGDELSVADRWKSELHAPFEILGCDKPYIKMTVVGSNQEHPVA